MIADFDRTITKATVKGMRGASCHGVVESLECLSEEYRSATDVLFKNYFPQEITPDLTIEEKIPIMKEWWVLTSPTLLSTLVAPKHVVETHIFGRQIHKLC